MNIGVLLSPTSVVVVGGTDSDTRIGGRTLKLITSFPYKGPVVSVNPRYTTLRGLPCYPDVRSIPFVPDLAILAVAADATLAALEECRQSGIKAAIILAAGFAELGTEEGRARQDALIRFSRSSGMAVAGPNTYGIVNFIENCYASFNLMYLDPPSQAVAPAPAVVSQGGGPCSIVYDNARRRGLGLSYAIASGNEVCTKLEDYLDYLADDESASSIVAYVEGLEDSGRFVKVAAKLAQSGKPLIVYKVGNTDAGASAAASHTARMAGKQAFFHAAFRQLNVVLADDVELLSELAYLFQFKHRLAGLRAGIVTASGALNAIFTDAFVSAGLTVPKISEALEHRIHQYVPSYGHTGHPIDLSAMIPAEDLEKVFDTVLASEELDFVVWFSTGGLIDRWASEFIRVASRTDKLLVCMYAGESQRAGDLEKAGIPVFRDTTKGTRAVAAFAWWHARRKEKSWTPPQEQDAPTEEPHSDVAQAVRDGRRFLDEQEAKQVLSSWKVPVIAEKAVTSSEEAVRVAGQFGFPVVMKVLSDDIQHKSDVGGVRLNIRTEQEVRTAFLSIMENVSRNAPDADLKGVLVQRQEESGLEILIAATQHASLGLVLSIASGGSSAELKADIVHRLLPLDREALRDALRELAIWPLFNGYRGNTAYDVDALLDVVIGLGRFMRAHSNHVAEVELNPVIVRPGNAGAAVVDAVIGLKV